jgi:hypothetical protein
MPIVAQTTITWNLVRAALTPDERMAIAENVYRGLSEAERKLLDSLIIDMIDTLKERRPCNRISIENAHQAAFEAILFGALEERWKEVEA